MISFGTKVAVLPGTSYGGLFAGHTGTVCKWHRATNKIGVNLDGVRNPESKEGIFWQRGKEDPRTVYARENHPVCGQ